MEDFPVKINLTGLAQKPDASGGTVSINLKPYEKGLRSILAPRPLYALSEVAWPFPQVFRLGLNHYVAIKDTIFRIDSNSLVPMLANIPNSGYPWDAAIVGDHCIFINNKSVIVGRTNLTLDPDLKIPTGLSICEVNSQLVIAAPWAYGEHHEQSVIWSQIGSADFTINRSNVAALRFADCGRVLKVIPQVIKTLGGIKKGFLAFGTTGVSSFLAESLPAGYSMVKISQAGIYSQLAAAGDETIQYYVSSDKKLHSVSEGKITELGYSSQLQGAGSEIVLSYDHFNKELWVSY